MGGTLEGSQATANTRLIEFKGAAKEYFGIWIVNLLLTIVTLGIFSAWAKVRRQRYFYGNTFLDGYNFDYHARPISILIGRIIVISAIVIYQVLITLSPVAGLIIIPYLFALPWIINRSLRFNARVSSYRNIRFDFAGSYWQAFMAFIVMPLVAVFSFGVLLPFASRKSARYVGNNLRYGQAEFRSDPRIGDLYRNFGASFLLWITAATLVIAIGALAIFTVGIDNDLVSQGTGGKPDIIAVFGLGLPIILIYAVAIFVFIFYQTGVRNVVYNATTLTEDHSLSSSVNRSGYAWVLISNLFAIVFTLGLLKPWATIRSWRYKTERTGMVSYAPMDDFVGTIQQEGAAAPAEYLDIEGIDLGF